MYCTLADIEKKRISTEALIQLTDDENLEVVNETTVNGFISDASVLVDGYLRGRYSLPLNPVPDLAKSITADLTIYGIYASQPQFPVPDAVKERRTTALALLTRIQDGKMPLYEPATAPTANASLVSLTSSERVCSRNSMGGY